MNHSEQVFYTYLTDVDALDVMARERFSTAEAREVIPTEAGRKITAWALEYYFENGRKLAPTPEAIKETWGEHMDRAEISLGDGTETDSVEWAIAQLRAQYAQYQSQEFVAGLAKAVAKADPDGKVTAVQRGATDLYRISQALIARRREMEASEGITAALADYFERAENNRRTEGMTFGWPQLDEHIHGVHGGEICVAAAASGVGKSWLGIHTLHHEWKCGRKVLLFSLELTLETVFERLACRAKGISYESWQNAECTDQETLRVIEYAEQLSASPNQPVVIMPPTGDRSMHSMVRQAQSYDADTIIIDQLTFVDAVEGSKSHQRWEAMGEKMRELAELISSGPYRPAVLLLHQMNRKGIEEAQKSGHYAMDHLAEGSEIERTASFVLAFFQSEMDRRMGHAELQMLKARRVKAKDFSMLWKLEYGMMHILNEIVVVDD